MRKRILSTVAAAAFATAGAVLAAPAAHAAGEISVDVLCYAPGRTTTQCGVLDLQGERGSVACTWTPAPYFGQGCAHVGIKCPSRAEYVYVTLDVVDSTGQTGRWESWTECINPGDGDD